eukprot:15162527-Alexandrium_andersonii.AAC.1
MPAWRISVSSDTAPRAGIRTARTTHPVCVRPGRLRRLTASFSKMGGSTPSGPTSVRPCS